MTQADPLRGTGRTTTQVNATPIGGIYVITAGMRGYMRGLLHGLGREDIKLRHVDWLLEGCWRGLDPKTIAVDHYVIETLHTEIRWRQFNDFLAYKELRK